MDDTIDQNLDYIAINKQAYEETASEFAEKVELRRASDEKLVEKLLGYFPCLSNEVLELGTGSGYIANLLCEHAQHVTAVEISPKMAEVAKGIAPEAKIIVDDFINHDFKDKTFDVVLGVAFIHLFTTEDAEKVMQKIYQLLKPGGVCVLSTTRHDQVTEGFIEKVNFETKVKRYRKQYTIESYKELVYKDLQEVTTFIEPDSEGNLGKEWINCVGKRI